MNEPCYVVASCKEWHENAYDMLKEEIPGNWLRVANTEELKEVLEQFEPRYIFFLHWSWYVDEEIVNKFECVCFHMTDVPYGRGGSPLQNLIKAGHKTTKLSALRMIPEMDAGPVYMKKPMSLEGRALEIYIQAGMISVEIIRWIIANEPKPEAQSGHSVYFRRRTPAESSLPEEADIAHLYDHIRMLDAPTYPPAFIDYGEFRIELTGARHRNGELVAEALIRKRGA